MNTILSKRNAVRPCRTAADAGLLRPDLHFFVALDVKAEVIEPDRLFFSLVQAPGSNIRQKQKSMLGPSVRLFSCLRHAVEIGESLRVRCVKGDMTNRHGSVPIRYIEGPRTNTNKVAIWIVYLILDAGIRITLNQGLVGIRGPRQFDQARTLPDRRQPI